MKIIISAVLILGAAVAGYVIYSRNSRPPQSHVSTRMKITSHAFGSYQNIPEKYTCDGINVNPPLEFEDVPASAKSLALIAEDPDAPLGTFTHWVLFNMPAKEPGVREGVPPNGIVGTNSFGKLGYGGPCPPGGTHHYVFKLFALDIMLQLPASADGAAVQKAMHSHVLASGELVGLYSRN